MKFTVETNEKTSGITKNLIALDSIKKMSVRLFSLTIFSFLLCVSYSHAQNVQYPDKKPDQMSKESLQIDPVTGALNIEMPLRVYTGRGGTSIPLSLRYSSKVWRMEYESFLNNQNCDYGPSTCSTNSITLTNPRFAPESSSGWTVSMQMPRISGDGLFVANGKDCVIGDCLQNPRHINRLFMHMPDGSSHEFRKDDAVHTGNAQLAGTYYSVDGTGMRFVRGNPEYTGTLYLPDGSRYLLEGMVNNQERGKYIDRSGNVLIYRSEDGGWTDTLGRLVQLPVGNSSPPEGDFNYELPGFGNTPNTYTLKWRKLEDALTNPSQPLRYTGDRDYTYNYYTPALFESDEANRFLVSLHNPVVLSELVLPDGRKYKFTYNIFGEIDKVVYPTGSYERYLHSYVQPKSVLTFPYYLANRGVVMRSVSTTGNSSDEFHWQYNYSLERTAITQPDNTVVEKYFHIGRHINDPGHVFGFDDERAGKQYEERVVAPGNIVKRRNLSKWEVRGPVTFNNQTGHPAATRDAYLSKELNLVFETGGTQALVALTEYEYDSHPDQTYRAHLNLKRSRQYAYVPATATWAKDASFQDLYSLFSNQLPGVVNESDYLYNETYKARNLNNLAIATRIRDANGTIKAQSETSFDETGFLLPSNGAMPSAAANSWIDPLSELGETVGSKRGFPTTIKSYIDVANNQYVTSYNFYDQYGNLRKVRDAGNNDTEIQYSADYAFAYPTKTVSPIPGGNGSNASFEMTSAYNYNTGLPISRTDQNGHTTQMSYSDPVSGIPDPLLRIRKITAPNGHQTITEYGVPDSNGNFSAAQRFVKVKSQIDETSWKEAYSWLDGLGRTILVQTVDSEGDVFTKTTFDNMGRVKKASNPFRGANTPDAELAWTENFYDELSRITKVKAPDLSEVNTAYSLAATGSQFGTVTTVADAAGRQKRSISNAFGQLVRIDEANDNNELGTVESPVQPTIYTYDTLNKLIGVLQGEQPRTFVYDALSRLKSVTNPESGMIQYTYDANGNVQTKRDARGIKTIYDYDALNRVIKRCYRVIGTGGLGMTTCAGNNETLEPNTLDVTYTYDSSNVSNSKGQLTKVTTGDPQNPFSITEYTEFDSMGKIKRSRQITDNLNIGESKYTYNLSGALIEQTYPTGRVVKNVLDSDGDLSIVQSRKNENAGFWNYAQHFSYTPSGEVSSVQLGNGRWQSTALNSRLQVIQTALGATENAADLLKLEYSYGTWENGTLNEQKNNGNLARQIITVPTVGGNAGFTATQVYTYDSLNRIKQATETIPNQSGWQQAFLYDRYGNRNFDESNTTTLPKNCGTAPNLTVCPADAAIVNPSVNPQNNHTNGHTFDNAGNTTRDAQNRKYTYDAENKQVKAETVDANGNVINTLGQYFYSGDGKRVKKYVPATQETTLFIYDASGKLIAEYSATNPQVPMVSYLTSDPLGSARINTNEYGDVMARHDYQPFGEEINRTNYGSDEVRQQFTGYERDNETDLDFAQARYYVKNLGRFSTTDPVIMTPKRAFDPQRINLYLYVRNNPLTLLDSSGEDIEDQHLNNNEKYQKWKEAFLQTEEGKRLWEKYNAKGFTLKIEWKDGINGASTDKYMFSGGKLVGATITLGSDIDNRDAAAGRSARDYPIQAALGAAVVDKTTMAVQVIAHEFGHVEDAAARPALYQLKQQYSDLANQKVKELGNMSKAFDDPEVKKRGEAVLKAFGVADWTALGTDTDRRAEKAAIPVIQQHLANTGEKIPKTVQKAINNLQGSN
jgi:RHS repeat-associated protein